MFSYVVMYHHVLYMVVKALRRIPDTSLLVVVFYLNTPKNCNYVCFHENLF